MCFCFATGVQKVLEKNSVCGDSGLKDITRNKYRNRVIECPEYGLSGKYLTVQKIKAEEWALTEVVVQLEDSVELFSELYGN